MYEADCCMGKKTPVLSRYFADEEFLGAKETIKTLVTVSMQDAASTDAASAQSFELEIIGWCGNVTLPRKKTKSGFKK